MERQFTREEWALGCREVLFEELELLVNRILSILCPFYSEEQVLTLLSSWLLDAINMLQKHHEEVKKHNYVDLDAFFKETIKKLSES